MELGNLLMGNSRGKYKVDRNLQDEFAKLLHTLDPHGYHGVYFDNEVFNMFPYYWGDCTCGADDDLTGETNHKEDCLLVKDNFVYKPLGIKIQWYKYPLRDAYSNIRITKKIMQDMVRNCLKSLTVVGETANG